MTAADGVAAVAQVAGGVALSPLAAGSIQHLKGRLQGRRGPSPANPYRELARLWRKSAVAPELAGPLYRLAPAIVVASLLLAIVLVPVGGRAAGWGSGHDALVLVGLLALGRFALAVAAWDSASAFALMGASRELTFAVFAEGVLALVILLAALTAGGDTDLTAMSAAAAGAAVWQQPLHWCAGLAFVLVALTEAGRQPIDNPDTHLELTMVHEGPLLEYAGRELALLQWAGAARLWLMLVLAAELFVPKAGPFAAQLAITAVAVWALCAGLAIVETLLARTRMLRVPLLLAGGGALCLIGLATRLVQGPA